MRHHLHVPHGEEQQAQLLFYAAAVLGPVAGLVWSVLS